MKRNIKFFYEKEKQIYEMYRTNAINFFHFLLYFDN